MAKLTQDKIDLMEISNAIFRNGVWSVLVMSPEKIGYRLFFEGSESDKDEDIIAKSIEKLLEFEEKRHDYSKFTTKPNTINKETIIGKKMK